MIDVEPLIRTELSRLLPAVLDRADWADVVGRSGLARRPWTRRPLAFAIAAALAVLLVATALATTFGGFNDWLRGAPGKRASEQAQQRFRAANGRSWAAFPISTELRELIRTRVAAREYVLYGFVSGESLCLKLAAEVAFQPQACAPRSALANTSAPFLVVLPTHTFVDRASRPTAQVSFGIAADGVRRVMVEATDGHHRALLGGNAYLFVEHQPNTGNRVLAVTAIDSRGRGTTLRLPDVWPPGSSGGNPGGPTRLEARISDPVVGWLERGEKRGAPAAGGIRFVKPDPLSDLAVGLSGNICLSAIDSAGRLGAQSCGSRLFSRGPINALISCQICGQFMELRGVAADGVARVVAFTADGSRLTVPLRHNVFAGRIGQTQFPIRLVGYDARDRVVASQLWNLGPGRTAPPAEARQLRSILSERGPNGTIARLHLGPKVKGYDCWRVDFSAGPPRGSCVPPYSGSRFALDLVQQVKRDLFLTGRVGDNVVRVELRFANRERAVTIPTRGHFLLSVPSRYLSQRRTSAFLVTLDREDTVRARQRVFFRLSGVPQR
jgi:hypothetical protein